MPFITALIRLEYFLDSVSIRPYLWVKIQHALDQLEFSRKCPVRMRIEIVSVYRMKPLRSQLVDPLQDGGNIRMVGLILKICVRDTVLTCRTTFGELFQTLSRPNRPNF